MPEIIHFIPRAELDADANLRDFIKLCRGQLTAFGYDLRFDDDIWDVTQAINLKAKNGVSRLLFTTWSTVNERIPVTMSEPFLSFAKAFIRYQHAFKPTTGVSQRLSALRALEAALTEEATSVHPSLVSPHTLNRAVQLIRDKYAPETARTVMGQLGMVADFLADHQLMAVPVRWRHPSVPPRRNEKRVGTEFDKRRHAKLPSPAALAALAKVFSAASDLSDVLVSLEFPEFGG